MATDVQDYRNIALVGHGDSGKTSLVETILHQTGTVNRRGRVEDGSTVCDYETDEKERTHSIRTALARCQHQGKTIQILDTPGYPDFIGECIGAMRGVETAIITVSATGGVSVNTRNVLALAEKEGVSRVVVVTKVDGENIELDPLIDQIRETFGEQCHLWNVPDGTGGNFSAVYNVLHPSDDMPPQVADRVASSRDPLMETIVEVDDQLVERYLDGEELSAEEIAQAATKAIASATVIPILFVSSEKEAGIKKLLDFIVSDLPSPVDGVQRKPFKVGSPDEAVERKPDASAPFSAQVLKIVSDAFVGKLAYLRVFSGSIPDNGTFMNSRVGKSDKVGNILELQGKEQKGVSSVSAGAIVAFSKVENLQVSDTLSDDKDPCEYPAIEFPVPMVQLAAEPKKRGDETKIGSALTRLAEEDGTFNINRNEQTHELVISGMSNLHLDIVLNRLKQRFEVDVETRVPAIPYLETITGKGDAKYRHKKQTGGAGQFGEVWLRVEALPRGEDFVFENKIVGGSIPQQYIPSCEKGVRAAMVEGIVSGNPVVDVKVQVYDGKHHPVDSKDIAFQIAARNAFREAFQAAKPVLLEPVVTLKVTVPSESMGDITGDLNSRRGRILGMEPGGRFQILEAEVPQAEIATYSTELRSITGGEGSYTMAFARYDVVPSNIAQEVMAKAKKAQEED